jgi:hypothetical protein
MLCLPSKQRKAQIQNTIVNLLSSHKLHTNQSVGCCSSSSTVYLKTSFSYCKHRIDASTYRLRHLKYEMFNVQFSVITEERWEGSTDVRVK